MSREEMVNYIKEHKENVKGIFLTHGHDSNMGAMADILYEMPDLPVYAFTANTESEDGSLYTDCGFNGYLAKPVDAKLLEKTILKHLPNNIVMV